MSKKEKIEFILIPFAISVIITEIVNYLFKLSIH